MARNQGLTYTEVVVVLFVIVVVAGAVLVLRPSFGHRHGHGITNRNKCASNLRSIAQGMQIYASQYNDQFPRVAAPTDDGLARGFDASARGTDDPPEMTNNVTAPLWMLVRLGSAGTDLFTCPSTMDSADDLKDAVGDSVPIAQTWDFKSADNLSYSMMNMNHTALRQHWSANAGSYWPLLGDDNNSTHPDRHTMSAVDASSRADVIAQENSDHHRLGEVQVFVFGDGHTKVFMHPFVGPQVPGTDFDHVQPWDRPFGDNAYAMRVDGENRPPSLKNDAGDGDEDDVFLLPITGAAGGDTTLDPSD